MGAGASALALVALAAGVPIAVTGLWFAQWQLVVAGPCLMLGGYCLLHLARSLLLVLGVRNRYTRLFEGDTNVLARDDRLYYAGACCLLLGLVPLASLNAEMGTRASYLLLGDWQLYTPVLLAAGVAIWTGLLAVIAAGAVWFLRDNAKENPQILKPDEAQNADRPPELAADEQVVRQHARSERFIREKQRLVSWPSEAPAERRALTLDAGSARAQPDGDPGRDRTRHRSDLLGIPPALSGPMLVRSAGERPRCPPRPSSPDSSMDVWPDVVG